jgi:hypothetical protein
MDMGKTSRDFIVNAISSRAHFVASGSMTGRTGGGLAADHQLRGEALDAYQAAQAGGAIRYTVYSYSTPIAWVTADDTTVPEIYYSQTTTRHQNIARAALL